MVGRRRAARRSAGAALVKAGASPYVVGDKLYDAFAGPGEAFGRRAAAHRGRRECPRASRPRAWCSTPPACARPRTSSASTSSSSRACAPSTSSGRVLVHRASARRREDAPRKLPRAQALDGFVRCVGQGNRQVRRHRQHRLRARGRRRAPRATWCASSSPARLRS